MWSPASRTLGPYAPERSRPMSDRPASRRAIDLSHEIVDGMVTHPGIPAPTISTFLTHEASAARYAPGTTFEIGRIDLVANTGTYLDTPAHRFAGRRGPERPRPRDGRRPRRRLVESAAARTPSRSSRTPSQGVQVAGRAVLVATGWDRPLGHGRLPHRQPVPDRGGGPPPGRGRRGADRDRLAQRRLARATHGDPRTP